MERTVTIAINKSCHQSYACLKFLVINNAFKDLCAMNAQYYIIILAYLLHFLAVTNGKIIGLQIDKYSDELKHDKLNIPIFLINEKVSIRFYGNVKSIEKIALTQHSTSCNFLISNSDSPVKQVEDNVISADLKLPSEGSQGNQVYFCAYVNGSWQHQGNEKHLSLIIEKQLLPHWLSFIIVFVCITISALCNGLTVGLMSLAVKELQVLQKAGTKKQKKYASIILPLRSKANFLLVNLLLGSTAFNTIFTLVTDSYIKSWFTILIVTTVIVIFCEILPSAFYTRFALSASAKTIFIPYILMYACFPITYCLGKILDKVLGQDMTMYTRAKLREMLEITEGVPKEEKDIITGALEMNTKKVEEVMTPINDIFMLPLTTVLDYTTVAEILSSGYSRIPIYDGERWNIVKVLFTKDLALLDPEDKIPVKVVLKLTKLENLYIEAGTTLDKVFHIFKEGDELDYK